MRDFRLLALMLACLLLLCACGEQKPAETTVPTTTAAPTTEPTTVPTTVPTEPPMDAATLLTLLRQVNEATDWTSAKESIACNWTLNLPVMGMAMQMSMEQEATILSDPAQEREYMEVKSTSVTYGQTMEGNSQCYTRMEDGVEVRYVYSVENKSWIKETVEEDDAPKFLESILEEGLILEEETQLLGELEVYVLHAEMSEEYCQELADSFMEGLGQEESSGRGNDDDVALACHAVIYVEKETSLVRGYTMDVEGLGVLMEKLFAQQFSDTAGTGMVTTVEVDMDTLHCELTEIGYDPVEVPEVSAKGIAASNQESFEPAQEDGTYIIQQGGNAVRLKPLSGWQVETVEYDSLVLNRGNDTTYAYYTMYNDDDTLEENVQYWVDFYLQEYGVTMDTGTGEPIDGHETMWYRGGGLYSWCMKVPVDDGYLFIEVVNYRNDNAYSYLEYSLDNCTVYDLTAVEAE